MKDAILDFGAVGDDATNNDAAAVAAVAYCNSTGGAVYWPAGVYRFASPLPALIKGALLGENMVRVDLSGTVFRLDAETGDTLSTGVGGRNVRIANIAFYPVRFKTGGYEIHDRGVDSLIENCGFFYCWNCIRFGGGANGSSARRLRAFAVFGPDFLLFEGTSSAPSDWSQAIVVDDFIYYNPWPIAQPSPSNFKGNWAAGAYAQGDVIRANGDIWQAKNAGTSVSAPAKSGLFTNANDPFSIFFNDNGVQWRFIESAMGTAFRMNSNALVVTLLNGQINVAGAAGGWMQHTLGGDAPYGLTCQNVWIDDTIGDCFAWQAGGIVSFTDCHFNESVAGRGITGFGTVTGGLTMTGGRVWKNALDGIQLPPKDGAGVTLQGVKVNGNGVKAANTYAGILVPAGLKGAVIQGCFAGTDAGGGGTQKYGINIVGGADDFAVTGNILRGNGTAGLFNGAGTGPSKIVANNIG